MNIEAMTLKMIMEQLTWCEEIMGNPGLEICSRYFQMFFLQTDTFRCLVLRDKVKSCFSILQESLTQVAMSILFPCVHVSTWTVMTLWNLDACSFGQVQCSKKIWALFCFFYYPVLYTVPIYNGIMTFVFVFAHCGLDLTCNAFVRFDWCAIEIRMGTT
jgi:hypothetical protein